jgi:hypothetical protein
VSDSVTEAVVHDFANRMHRAACALKNSSLSDIRHRNQTAAARLFRIAHSDGRIESCGGDQWLALSLAVARFKGTLGLEGVDLTGAPRSKPAEFSGLSTAIANKRQELKLAMMDGKGLAELARIQRAIAWLESAMANRSAPGHTENPPKPSLD